MARQSLGNLLAVVQYHHAIDDAHQHAHDVLDPNNGDAELVADLAQHVGGLVASALASSSFFNPAAPSPSTWETRSVGRPTMASACSAAASAFSRLCRPWPK